MPNPVVSWQIEAKDPEKLYGFYSQLFGWENGPEGHVLSLDTKAGEGINGGLHLIHHEGSASSLMLCIRVDDVRKYLDKVEGMGAKIITEARQVSDGRTIGTFSDPEGIAIQLFSLATTDDGHSHNEGEDHGHLHGPGGHTH